MLGWVRTVRLAPALAAGTAAAWAADWRTGLLVAAVTCAAAVVVTALATRAAAARFLAAAESLAPSEQEQALALRVGLDLATVMAAKAAVKAAVRETMVRRGAGLAALCGGLSAREAEVLERVRASAGPAAAESLVSGTAAARASFSDQGAESRAAKAQAALLAAGSVSAVGEKDVGSERQDAF